MLRCVLRHQALDVVRPTNICRSCPMSISIMHPHRCSKPPTAPSYSSMILLPYSEWSTRAWSCFRRQGNRAVASVHTRRVSQPCLVYLLSKGGLQTYSVLLTWTIRLLKLLRMVSEHESIRCNPAKTMAVSISLLRCLPYASLLRRSRPLDCGIPGGNAS